MAGNSGGIGYAYRSELLYFEDNGYYFSNEIQFIKITKIDNSAGDFGGIWFIDIPARRVQKEYFIIQRTTIEKSLAYKSKFLTN